MSFEPLCPDLYDVLERRFGAVHVSRHGEAFDGDPILDPATGQVAWDVRNWGETYSISCPFCSDTRQRLGLSHAYGQPDLARPGRRMTWLVNCFNEGCLRNDHPLGACNREALEEMVFGISRPGDGVARMPVRPGVVVPAELRAVTLPGEVVPLDQLPPRNPAAAYMAGRGYDIKELSAVFGVGACVAADPRWPACQGRVIIPITMDGILVGWQARHPGELDWKATGVHKYLNMPRMPKRLMLYNLDRACAGRAVVVVEGVTKVWAVGDRAVALLGHDVSPQQRELLTHHWAMRGGLLVLILDADSAAQQARYYPVLRETFRANSGEALAVRPPPGVDIGDRPREETWAMIHQAGRDAGVDVAAYVRP